MRARALLARECVCVHARVRERAQSPKRAFECAVDSVHTCEQSGSWNIRFRTLSGGTISRLARARSPSILSLTPATANVEQTKTASRSHGRRARPTLARGEPRPPHAPASREYCGHWAGHDMAYRGGLAARLGRPPSREGVGSRQRRCTLKQLARSAKYRMDSRSECSHSVLRVLLEGLAGLADGVSTLHWALTGTHTCAA